MTVRGRGVRVSDLAIDGGGRATRAIGVAAGSHDVRLQRIDIRGIRRTGVEVWGEHSDISIQDSSIAGDGARGAGIFELGSDDTRHRRHPDPHQRVPDPRHQLRPARL